MLISRTLFATREASRQLLRLCRHFDHKAEAQWDTVRGSIRLDIGVCRLLAEERGLHLECEAEDDARLAQLQELIRIHLQRFAGLDELELDWRAS